MFAKLSYGTRFKIEGQEYEIRKAFDNDFEVHNITYDNIELITLGELLTAYNKKVLSFAQDAKDPTKEIVKWDLNLYSPEQKQEMDTRYSVIEPYYSSKLKDIKSYLERYPAQLRPNTTPTLSTATFYRWVNRYNKKQSKFDLISLKTGPKGRRVDEHVMDELREFIKRKDKLAEASTTRDKWSLFNETIRRINVCRDEKYLLPELTESTFRRVFAELHDPYPRDKEILGVSQADLKKNGVRQGIIAERPLEYVELDWTPLDYVIVNFDDGEVFRPIVLIAMDVYSDEPMGYFITFKQNPSAADWKQLLLHVLLPKTDIKELYPKVKKEWSAFGKPENIILDNASVNDSQEIAEICGVLGIGFIFNEKAAGHQKAIVENGLGQINRVFHSFKGTTFSNVDDKGQYNSEKNACIDINLLHHMLHIVLIDLMANKHNQGKGGYPEDLWREGLRKSKIHRTLPYRRDYLELLFATNTEYRTLTPKGIELKGEFYFSEEINKLRLRIENEGRNREVRVRFGGDLRIIYVYDEKDSRYLVANLKQSSKLSRLGVDQKYPVHLEHLEYLCNKNNSNSYAYRRKSNNAKALLSLEELVNEGKKEYAATKRERNRVEASRTSLVSAITGSRDLILLTPDNSDVILLDNKKDGPSKSKRINNTRDSGRIEKDLSNGFTPSEVTVDVDLDQLASQWEVGIKGADANN